MLEWSYNVLKNVSEANSSLYKYIKKEIKIELGQFCKISLFISNNCYCGHKSNEHTLCDNKYSKKEFCNCVGFLA